MDNAPINPETAMPFAQKLLIPSEVTELLGVRPNTLSVWRCHKRYELPYVKIGRLIRYRRSDVEKFLAQHTVTPQAVEI